MDIFKYPDMKAYKDCIGTGDIMVNVLYSQLLCTFGLNNQDAISSIELILLACSINIFVICSYYLLFKDFLNRKGQILFILLLSFHPYLAIYFPRFFTDLFGPIGILLICYYVVKKIELNLIFLILSLILINLRASLMPPLFFYALYVFVKYFRETNKINLNSLFLMILIILNFFLYKTFSDTFIQNNNFYDNRLFNIIFLLGFREGAANEGFTNIFFYGGVNGYIQFLISIMMLIMHSIGIYGLLKFSYEKNLYEVTSVLTVLIVPLIAISHMRYLLPIIPLLLFSFAWYFFRKN
tara:strand:+ start:1187 stop:2074 length:888 start_codon:yes stop_codon:yes gene_type:complete